MPLVRIERWVGDPINCPQEAGACPKCADHEKCKRVSFNVIMAHLGGKESKGVCVIAKEIDVRDKNLASCVASNGGEK
jgi:hypothetical protein